MGGGVAIGEGLESGRWAILMKLHHCLADGVAAVDLLTVLLDDETGEFLEMHGRLTVVTETKPGLGNPELPGARVAWNAIGSTHQEFIVMLLPTRAQREAVAALGYQVTVPVEQHARSGVAADAGGDGGGASRLHRSHRC